VRNKELGVRSKKAQNAKLTQFGKELDSITVESDL